MERMKDVYDKMAKAEGKMEAMCEQCAGGKSVAFLSEFICVCSHATPLLCAPPSHFFCMRIYSNQTWWQLLASAPPSAAYSASAVALIGD